MRKLNLNSKKFIQTFIFMKKIRLDKESEHAIIDRILKLSPESNGLWGNLTINEMLFHCMKVNKEILQGTQQRKMPTLKQLIIKFVGLYLLKEFPRGIKTNAKFLPTSADNLDFDRMQTQLIESVKQVVNFKSDFLGNHPFFGPLKTNEWRRFMYKHIDHHLRQFQV